MPADSDRRIIWEDQSPPDPDDSQDGDGPAAFPQSHNNIQFRTPMLDQMGRDLTQYAREGRLKPLFGRQKELRALQRILLRKEKNNGLLVGAPGVGKTALVEGLANLVIREDCNEELKDIRIVELSPSSLVANTEYRGALESRLQTIIDEASSHPELILFIDEVHTLIRAGAIGGGTLDAANILKPALARGDIRCIGATTLDEYDQYLRKDSAFERRFVPLILDEPTESEAIEILNYSIESYASHHGVEIDPGAIEAVVRMSNRHILDRRLPDKAFDLLDSACTFARLPDEAFSDDLQHEKRVDVSTVERALANKLDIPVEKLSEDYREKLSSLEEFLNDHIFGQPHAMDHISSAIINAYLGLGNPDRPKAILAFFGASGVGKTATTRAISSFLFDSPDSIIRLDMSEYNESYAISRLFGAPPGYIGYDDEGTFSTRLRRQPHSIVLLDEIEKAHPEVQDAFLQIFDEGRFSDAHGRMVDARQAIFILTSNLFTVDEIESDEIYEQQVDQIRLALAGIFRPEFVNRINEIIPFRELDEQDLKKIAQKELENINTRISRYQVHVSASEEALDWIAKESFDPNSGARGVFRTMNRELSEPISDMIVDNLLLPGQLIELKIKDGSPVLDLIDGET